MLEGASPDTQHFIFRSSLVLLLDLYKGSELELSFPPFPCLQLFAVCKLCISTVATPMAEILVKNSPSVMASKQ